MLKKTCFLLAHNAVVKRRMGGLLIIRENSTSNTRASGSLLTDEENVQRQYRLNPEYPAVIPPSYHSSVELQRYESHMLTKKLQQIPTVPEKIAEINPFERDWTRPERRWHRPWHQPLVSPRGGWDVPLIPLTYNILPFYKFITKTHVVNQLPSFYDSLDVESEFQSFKESVLLRWRIEMSQNPNKRLVKPADQVEEFSAGVLMEILENVACQLFSAHHDHIPFCHTSWQSPFEVFWIRSGFQELYDPYHEKVIEAFLPETLDKPARLIGDSRHRRGQLVFSCRHISSIQIRSELPLTPFVPQRGGLASEPVRKYVFDPGMLGLRRDNSPLWMKPGFEYGDECEFTSLLAVPMNKVSQQISEWNGGEDDLADCFLAAGIMTGFSNLCATAHFLGFTQYTDLTYPLTTQVILSDGITWELLCYQLNSVALANDWEECETPSNICWRSGPQKMFDIYDAASGDFTGLNEALLKTCLKFILNKPTLPAKNVNLRPFVDIRMGRPPPVAIENPEKKRNKSGPTKYNLSYWYKDQSRLADGQE